MSWLLIISYILLFVVAIAAWINTKILMDEISLIKKHLGIEEAGPTDSVGLQFPSEVPNLSELENPHQK